MLSATACGAQAFFFSLHCDGHGKFGFAGHGDDGPTLPVFASNSVAEPLRPLKVE
jgi:hypothetical protein